MRIEFALIGVCMVFSARVAAQDSEIVRFIGPNPETGSSLAVVVHKSGLIHTGQLFPLDKEGKVVDKSARGQADDLLGQLSSAVEKAAGQNPQGSRLCKCNVYVTDLESVADIQEAFAKKYSSTHRPAVSYVVTKLPHKGCLVAMDGVAAHSEIAGKSPRIHPLGDHPPAVATVSPHGSLIYIAGQAEKGETLAAATKNTLESLKRTVEYLGCELTDVVHVKSFLSPMSQVAEAQSEFSNFFANIPTPPSSWVEWTTPLIEIEMVVWKKKDKSQPAVEFITPPGMTSSPVFSRVAKVNSDRIIYTSGLYARMQTDAAGEVTDIFEQLGGVLKETGSDWKHLAKATYYCSTNDTSAKLNELRPKYYDPSRPPSASKALVNGVGRAARGLTIDMIVVPTE